MPAPQVIPLISLRLPLLPSFHNNPAAADNTSDLLHNILQADIHTVADTHPWAVVHTVRNIQTAEDPTLGYSGSLEVDKDVDQEPSIADDYARRTSVARLAVGLAVEVDKASEGLAEQYVR